MKTFLMHPDRDFDLQQELPWQADALTLDLGLDTLVQAMAAEDPFLQDVARRALLGGLKNDVATVLYRQAVLRDCMVNADVVRDLYAVAVEAVERRSGHLRLGVFARYPSGVLYEGVELMRFLADMLTKLRSIVDRSADAFESAGFRTLFATLQCELSDEYLAQIRAHLEDLRFRRGLLLSFQLDDANAGTNCVLHREGKRKGNWLDRILGHGLRAYTFHIDPRDEAGARALGDLRDRGINLVANAVAQSADHVLSFFHMLRTELAFYVGCLNLRERLERKGVPTCLPSPEPVGARRRRFGDLRDACLALALAREVVGNTLEADGKSLIVITGANQGGKSTFLRSLGIAQLMLQCGMFVTAQSGAASLCTDLFTHFRREEDTAMVHGKLDEELARMGEIADHLRPDALVLFNESFASTNEREGSEIARQIVRALLESRVEVHFVTHLHPLARGLYERRSEDMLFLRAERREDGARTFKVAEGEPLQTSYGEDLYHQVFAAPPGLRTMARAGVVCSDG